MTEARSDCKLVNGSNTQKEITLDPTVAEVISEVDISLLKEEQRTGKERAYYSSD